MGGRKKARTGPLRAGHSNIRGHHPNGKPPAHTVEGCNEGLCGDSMEGNYVDQSPQKHASLGGAEGLRKTGSISLLWDEGHMTEDRQIVVMKPSVRQSEQLPGKVTQECLLRHDCFLGEDTAITLQRFSNKCRNVWDSQIHVFVNLYTSSSSSICNI